MGVAGLSIVDLVEKGEKHIMKPVTFWNLQEFGNEY